MRPGSTFRLGGWLGLTAFTLGGVQPPTEPQAAPWRALIGATAVEIRTLPGEVRIGLAGDSGAVSLVLRAGDVRRFADSATRLLAPRRARVRDWSLRLEEPGVRSGTLVISRGTTRLRGEWFRIFASDDPLTGLTDSVRATDVRLLVQKLREAAAVASPPAARPKRGA